MSIKAGLKLGPYEIIEPIGAGGMGEVWRAHDERIGRDVAIKVLPASYAENEDRLRRFEQEARAAGVLNHPNLLTIHDLGTHDGAPYIVSELLEGQTLRDLLGDTRTRSNPPGDQDSGRRSSFTRGRVLSSRKAIDYATQIAQGLAAAHEKGIVHRDLKPENLFVTKDGRVKILDFGLAKLTEANDSEWTDAATVNRGTDPGTVLGTVGYMSPEQVRGGSADHRTDIFAFGAILYEMLSGRRAFDGESKVEALNAILKEDPPELSESNVGISAGLERIVEHCLEKSPTERFQSARDLAFQLGVVTSASGDTGAMSTIGTRRGRAPIIVAIGAIAMIAAAFLAGRASVGNLAETPASSSASEELPIPPTFHRLTFEEGLLLNARFGADGETVLYSARWKGREEPELFATQLGAPGARSLGRTGLLLASVSPTNELALIEQSRRVLSRAPLTGSAPREVAANVADAVWSPNGEDFAVIRQLGGRGGTRTVEYPVGNVLFETQSNIGHPCFSHDGKQLAVLHLSEGRWAPIVIDIDTKKAHVSPPIWEFASGIGWSPGNAELWISANETIEPRSIWGYRIEDSRLRSVLRIPSNVDLLDVTADGRVLMTRVSTQSRARYVGPDRKEIDLTWSGLSLVTTLSYDGTKVLFEVVGEGARPDATVYLRDIGQPEPVALGGGVSSDLSPDLGWVATTTVTAPEKVVLLPTGAGQPRELDMTPLDNFEDVFFTPDGKSLILQGNAPNEPTRVYEFEIESGKIRAISPDDTSLVGRSISPDGRRILVSREGKRPQILNLDNGTFDEIAFPERLPVIGWYEDSEQIFVTRAEGNIVEILLLDPSSGSLRPVTTSELPFDGPGSWGYGVITPDGNSWAYSAGLDTYDLYYVEGLR